MKKKYEDACRKAGLSEEKIRQIRKLYDVDKQRLKRQKKSRKQKDIRIIPFSSIIFPTDISDERDIPDLDFDLEENVIRGIFYEQLESALNDLDPRDRDLILICFDPAVSLRASAKKLQIPLTTLIEARDRILKILRIKLSVQDESSGSSAGRIQKKRGQINE